MSLQNKEEDRRAACYYLECLSMLKKVVPKAHGGISPFSRIDQENIFIHSGLVIKKKPMTNMATNKKEKKTRRVT